MPSRGKKKTTMAKLNRESRLRERKAEKEARKEARRHAAMFGPPEQAGGVESQEVEAGQSSEVQAGQSPTSTPADPPRLTPPATRRRARG